MPRAKGVKHLGAWAEDRSILTAMCDGPIRVNDTIMDPDEDKEGKQMVAAREDKSLCPTCWKLMDAYAVGYSAGQLSLLKRMMMDGTIDVGELAPSGSVVAHGSDMDH